MATIYHILEDIHFNLELAILLVLLVWVYVSKIAFVHLRR